MGTVIILPETTKNPITLIGERAGVCYGSDITDKKKCYKRGIDCIRSRHGRVLEYVNVEMILDGYSARVIREWYTHIGGSPTRLQSSTRYINYSDFDYVCPASVKRDDDAWELWSNAIRAIKEALSYLEVYDVPKEDMAMLLPLCMKTKIVDKRNLRNLIEMSHQRLCGRAYWEYRQLMHDVSKALAEYSDEWLTIVDELFVPKCVELDGCPEKISCGYFTGYEK